MSDLVAVARDLYGLGLGAFIAERDRRARALRADGDRKLAKAVTGLRKPSVGAWAANMLAQHRPDVLEEVAQVGADLRQAQADLDRSRLRALDRDRRRVLRDAVSAGRALGAELDQNVSDAAAADLETILRAAMSDPRAADALRSGLLVGTMEATGLGSVDLDGALAVPGVVPDAQAADDLVEVGGRSGGAGGADDGGGPEKGGAEKGGATDPEAGSEGGDASEDGDRADDGDHSDDDAGAEAGEVPAAGRAKPGRKNSRAAGGGAAGEEHSRTPLDRPTKAPTRTSAQEHRRARAMERAQAKRERAEAREAAATEKLRDAEERARTVQARILQLQSEIEELRRGIDEREHALDRAEDTLAVAETSRHRAARRAEEARDAADAAREELEHLQDAD